MTRMAVTADTNVLVRAVVNDDPKQAAAARKLLEGTDQIMVPVVVLCEFVWVLGRGYRYGTTQIAHAVSALLEVGSVVTDRAAAEAGLAMLLKGGDFADGVIAFQGESMGGTVFASFDRSAVKRIKEAGVQAADPTELLSSH
jgi:predicted nucleic-acid-binding protein